MKKLISMICTLAMVVAMMTSFAVMAEEVPKVGFDPELPIPGESVTFLYDQAEIPAFFGWYVLPSAMVELDGDGNPVGFAADAVWWVDTNVPQYGQTIDLPLYTDGKYLYCQASRGADQDYSTIQASYIVKIAGEEILEEVLPPDAPDFPEMKRTVFGFENVADGVNIGVAGSDFGPTEVRRPSGHLWNPAAATWASTEWSTFTGQYTLNSVAYEDAPEGEKAGKWTSKLGETYPEGGAFYSSSLLSLYLDDPKNTYVVGATEFMFWVDTSAYYVPDEDIEFVPRPSVQVYDGDEPTTMYATYMPNSDARAYWYDETEEKWVGRYADTSGFFRIPSGYVGYVRIPLEFYEPASWTADAPDVMPLNNVIQMVFYFGTWAGEGSMDTYAYIDDLSFAGDDMPEMPLKYYEEEIDPMDGLRGPDGVEFEEIYDDEIGGTKVSVSWDTIDPFAASYELYVYEMEDEDDFIGTWVMTFEDLVDAEYEITGLENETMYSIQVYAYNSDGERIAIYDYLTFTTTDAVDGDDDSSVVDDDDTTPGDSSTTGIILMAMIAMTAILYSRKRLKA